MAITRGATASKLSSSATGTDASITHTVDSGTSLLVVTLHTHAEETVSGTPSWSGGGGENLTLVHQTTPSGANGDTTTWIYALLSPTAATGTVTITTSDSTNRFASATNYLGTETSSLGAAIIYRAEDVNNSATSTTVLPPSSSTGTSGNTLFIAANTKGGDMGPASNDSTFVEIWDEATGSSTTTDSAVYVAEKIGIASAEQVTITWAGSDENSGLIVEIVASAGGGGSTPPQLALMGVGT